MLNSSSIKEKILKLTIITVMTAVITVMAIAVVFNYNSVIDTASATLPHITQQAANSISGQLEGVKKVATTIGCTASVANFGNPIDDRMKIVNERVAQFGYSRGDLISGAGISETTGLDYSGHPAFAAAKAGQTYISDPVTDDQGNQEIIVAAPLWDRGMNGTLVMGVVFIYPQPDLLPGIIADIKPSENALTYILDANGTNIASQKMERVISGENVIELAKTNTGLAKLAAEQAKMTQGETAIAKYRYGGAEKFMAYTPVPGTPGWSLAVCVDTADYMGMTYKLIVLCALLALGICAWTAFISMFVAGRISKPVTLCMKRLELLSQGDLTTPVPDTQAKDETAKMLVSLQATTTQLYQLVSELNRVIGGIAEGDLTVDFTGEFVGDYESLGVSVKTILSSLNETMLSISTSASEVASGANQVSNGAQALAEGTTQQAGSVNDLSLTINGVSAQIDESAQHAALASQKANAVGSSMRETGSQVQRMTSAMAEITEKSNQIGKIIKTIDDIAFQTNILALNAAVEAARAGEAGKGFAVVADEVRNLAQKSASAAKNTASLIEGTIVAVENGSQITNNTAKALLASVESTHEVSRIIDSISEATNIQANSLRGVTVGINTISDVVQSNTATSEESAAAAQELAAQAAVLKEQVSKFRIKNM